MSGSEVHRSDGMRPPRLARHDSRVTLNLTGISMSLRRTILYSRAGNRILRGMARPFSAVIPDSLKFPVVGIITVKLPEGRKVAIEANPTSYLAKRLFWYGHEGFEPGVFRVFRALLGQSEVFFDVGANIGYYSLLAALYAPRLEIHAFEPLPAAFRQLVRNRDLNRARSIVVHQMAISDREGSLPFFSARSDAFPFIADQLTSTGSLNREQADVSDQLDTHMVRTETLDAFVARNGIGPVDLMKLDTEATEHLVLAGAMQTISVQHPVILCEVLPGRVEEEVEGLVRALSYRMFSVRQEGLHPVDTLVHGNERTNDFLFCHPSRLHLVEPLIA